jgi:hypothetical protein
MDGVKQSWILAVAALLGAGCGTESPVEDLSYDLPASACEVRSLCTETDDPTVSCKCDRWSKAINATLPIPFGACLLTCSDMTEIECPAGVRVCTPFDPPGRPCCRAVAQGPGPHCTPWSGPCSGQSFSASAVEDDGPEGAQRE